LAARDLGSFLSRNSEQPHPRRERHGTIKEFWIATKCATGTNTYKTQEDLVRVFIEFLKHASLPQRRMMAAR
jgi:hypothetical protein